MTPLASHRVDAYLDRLGIEEVTCDAAGLAALQRAHLKAVPFHNVLLLANDGRSRPLPPLLEVVDAAIAGVGGNCDRTTPSFTALLRSLGFDAHLAAATVREPGNHFACVVELSGERYLCDVGNGHPYLRPWLLDGPDQEQSHLGWRFRFRPQGSGGPTLLRWMGGEDWKTVYVLDSTARAYEDFADIVDAHYSQVGFGPFLSGLRATRLSEQAFLTLRDADYARDTDRGRSLRRVIGREAFASLLVESFGLPLRIVDDALSVLARARPELFVEPSWVSRGRGVIVEKELSPAPPRAEVPDVLVTMATVREAKAVRRTLDSLAVELDASSYPGRVGVLLVDARPPGEWDVDDLEGLDLPVHRLPLSALGDALHRAGRTGVIPTTVPGVPPIGVTREAQMAAVRSHLARPFRDLPHPERHPTVLWVVDDDVRFAQLGDDGELRRRTDLLFRIARFWSTLPDRSVLLGSFTGDPPVPALDSLGGQLDDLVRNVERMLALGPDSAWDPPPSPPPTYDAYYDLTEAPLPRDGDVWPYAPRVRASVATVAAMLLRDLPRLVQGKQLTRPLTWNGEEESPRPSLRRGGNVVFLDLDALFRWPTPVLACSDGVHTRRAGTIWAALAQNEDPRAVVEVTLPLHHERGAQSLLGVDVSAETAAQVRGVALARALAEGRAVRSELPAREERVTEQRTALRDRIRRLVLVVRRLRIWRDPDVDGALGPALESLLALDQVVAAARPAPGVPAELEAFLQQLPEAVRRWREGP